MKQQTQRGRYAGIARVLIEGGPVFDPITGRHFSHAGMAIALDAHRVLTCAHVVNTALRRPQETAAKPAGQVSICFPFAAAPTAIRGEVDRWFAPTEGMPKDIALITLEQPIPAEVGAATFQHIGIAESLEGDEVAIYGFAAGSDTAHHVSARLMGATSPEEMQLDGLTPLGMFVESGYSGAAVWNVKHATFVGMASARSTRNADRVAYMIPASELDKAVPGLTVPATPTEMEKAFADYAAGKRAGFVGRSHVFAAIQAFIAAHRCGYLTLIGDPGIGKSAILSELTRRTECAAEFYFIRAAGVTAEHLFHTHVSLQLSRRFGLSGVSAPGTPTALALRELLTQAADKLAGQRLIVVVDALDECDEVSGPNRSCNVLQLPRDLPANVYFILSRRELDGSKFNIALETEAVVSNELLDLMHSASENRADVELYLAAFFTDPQSRAWLNAHNLTVSEAVEFLGDRSESNFVYLHHVLPHLKAHPEALTPKSLPQGLTQYYLGHWRRMVAAGFESPAVRRALAMIYVLTVARRAVTRSQLLELIPDSDPVGLADAIAQWREFLDERPGPNPAYRLYHASFAEFLAEQNAVVLQGELWRGASRLLKAWTLRKLGSGARG